MINPNILVEKNTVPYSCIRLSNTFSERIKGELCRTYPTDGYIRIYENSSVRNYFYEARNLVSMDGNIYRGLSLSDAWGTFALTLLTPEYRKFIQELSGVDVTDLPMEANIYKYHKDCFMDAHPDMDTKVLTHVFYFNETWDEKNGGCLRVLNSSNEDDVAFKVLPLIGNSFIIVRSDNSWHSVEKTLVEESRRSVTVTFYKKDSKSPMWHENQNNDFHENAM